MPRKLTIGKTSKISSRKIVGNNRAKQQSQRKPQLMAEFFCALWALMIAMGLGIIAWPGQAQAWTGQPLAYVTSTDGISVIDTGDNKIVDTIPFCSTAAVTPDGKHVYAFGPNTSDF